MPSDVAPFYCVSCGTRLPVEGDLCGRCVSLAECAEVCTSGCHADDCEHHGHIPSPDERQAALPSREDWAANGLAALDHLDSLYYAGEPGGVTVADYRAATDAIRAALAVAQVPAERLDTGRPFDGWHGGRHDRDDTNETCPDCWRDAYEGTYPSHPAATPSAQDEGMPRDG